MNSTAALERSERVELLALLRERERRQARRKLFTYFPDTGPLRRELYQQHLEFFRLGKTIATRCFMAANRTGKTESGGGYELTLHLTGRYPEWWEGRRFVHPIDAWAAGDTNETVRDIIQLKLLGREEEGWGTGLIPAEDVVRVVKRQNGNGAVDYVIVRRQGGGESRLGFKSYEQGRKAFQGTEKHVVWLDEESEEGIRSECVMRLMTTDGLLIETFTPLRGLTPIVVKYLGDDAGIPEDRRSVQGDRAMVMAGWDDVPHLSAEQKTRMLAEAETHLVESRSKGVPSIGSGAIYPIAESEIVVDDFAVPAHWPRAYGLDVGWNCTAAVFGALDREGDCLYLYSLHYQGQQEPSTHVAGIRGRGKWIPGVIDPASRGRSQKDGEQLMELYTQLGLDIIVADNSRESGLYAVHQRLATGRLKVFKSLKPWLAEYRIYRRDEKGNVVKQKDHAMDACLVGDTLVHTDRGLARIADLVGVTGKVISRSGSACGFIGARKTIEDTRVITVRFSDGSAVTCTPDHPFLTPNGWCRADQLTNKDCYNGISQSIQVSAWKSASFLGRFRSFGVSATTFAVGISSVMAFASTALFGRLQTAAACLAGSTFTMTTGTDRTTRRTTSSSSAGLNTSGITCWATSGLSRVLRSMLRQGGISQTRVGIGTKPTMQSTEPSCMQGLCSAASTVVSHSRPQFEGQTASAPTTARPNRAKRLALTMSNALAWSAAAASWRIATLSKPAARANALLRCLSVEEAGTADVYCLTVPATSSFCVASGAVVHNTRYLVVSGVDVARVDVSSSAAAYRALRGLA